MHSGKSEGERERMGRMEGLLCYRSLFFPVGHSLSSACIAMGRGKGYFFFLPLVCWLFCVLSLVCHCPSYKRMHTATRFTETGDKKQILEDERTDREQEDRQREKKKD